MEAVNARHSMSRAIAAYTSLQSSALHPFCSSSSAAEQLQDCTAGNGTPEARAQQEDLKGGRRGRKPQQDEADNTADTLSEKSEQTTGITDICMQDTRHPNKGKPEAFCCPAIAGQRLEEVQVGQRL